MRDALLVVAMLSGCTIAHPPVTGRIVDDTLDSAILGEPMKLLVRLPPDYDREPARRYPVVYQLDGLFLDQLGVTAGLASHLAQRGRIEEPIVVGIGYGYPDGLGTGRFRDFVASGAERYLRFLTDELIPRIESRHRIDSTRGRALFGHSLGGFFALYALLHPPQPFAHLVAGDPSYYEGDDALFEYEQRHPTLTGTLYVTAGEIGSAEQPARHDAFTAKLTAYPTLRVTSEILHTDHLGAIAPTFERGLELLYRIP